MKKTGKPEIVCVTTFHSQNNPGFSTVTVLGTCFGGNSLMSQIDLSHLTISFIMSTYVHGILDAIKYELSSLGNTISNHNCIDHQPYFSSSSYTVSPHSYFILVIPSWLHYAQCGCLPSLVYYIHSFIPSLYKESCFVKFLITKVYQNHFATFQTLKQKNY